MDNFNAMLTTLAVAVILAFIVVALSGCQQQIKFNLERVPSEYRACAVEVVPQLASRSITQKELILGYAKLKRYAGRQNRCYRGLISWADAQYKAYYNSY